MVQSTGMRTAVKADLVDLYKTLVELTGGAAALESLQPDVQGQSLAPLFANPTAPPPTPLAQKHSYSQMARCSCGPVFKYRDCPIPAAGVLECSADACHSTPMQLIHFMGYSMRTADGRWRLTAWYPWNNATMAAEWGKVAAVELYNASGDHGRNYDYGGYSRNLAAEPQLATTRATLLSKLEAAAMEWP